ncbi:ATP synthase subunit J, mitochondrial [Phlyctema vagabunda]|uniref:ATP synthase subunit J, mitochondrial n=1 Tax=Phlyctema vagabunda TaxID=108571 RepID=A0ABR4PAX2_9HELO
MSFYGLKKFPAPVAAPMAPFYAAGLVVAYGIYSFSVVMKNTAEFKNDPRNPDFKGVKPAADH